MTHKLATWGEQFDTFGCVGCGRCITWCPVAIDITEEAIRATDGGGRRPEGRAMKAMDALIAEAPAFAGLDAEAPGADRRVRDQRACSRG